MFFAILIGKNVAKRWKARTKQHEIIIRNYANFKLLFSTSTIIIILTLLFLRNTWVCVYTNGARTIIMLIRTWLVEMMTRIFLIITVMRSDAKRAQSPFQF